MLKHRILSFFMALCLLVTMLPVMAIQADAAPACEAPVVTGGHNTGSYPGKPRLTWEAVQGAEKYEIYRADSQDGSYALKYTTTGCNFTNTSAVSGTTYYYKVAAVAADGVRTYSAVACVTAACAAPVVTGGHNTGSYPGKPQLKWEAVKGAVKYEIYRADSQDGSYVRKSTTTGRGFTNTSAVSGTTYYYKVAAVTADGARTYSDVVCVTAACAAPVVTGGYSTANPGKPRLTWEAVSGAAKYQIYRATGENGAYTLKYTTTGCSFTNSSAEGGMTYYYKVAAVTADGALTYSDVVCITTACDMPFVSAGHNTGSYPGKPCLTWEAVQGAVKYEIYRADSQDGSYVRKSTTTGCIFTNTSAVSGTTYYYKVAAVDAYGTKSYSDVVCVTAACATPVVTGGYSTANPGKPRLTWEAVQGAVQYEIYRATGKNGTYTLKYTTTGCSFTNSSAVKGTTYYYKVAAVTIDGARTYSDIVCLTAGCAAPEVTISHNAASYPGKPQLNWDAVKGAAKYEIYRADSRDGSYVRKSTTTGCIFTNISAEVGKTYYYKVAAVTAQGYRTYSDIVSITTACGAPEASYKLVSGTHDGTPYTKEPKISWDAVEGAVNYKVYRSSSKNGTYELRVTNKKDNLSYTNYSAPYGHVYYYKVAAVDAHGVKTYSKPIKVLLKCATPELSISRWNGIRDDAPCVGKPKLNWLVVNGAKSYQVYRSTSGQTGTYSLRDTTTKSYYIDYDAKSGTRYYYKVRAIAAESVANSAYSSGRSLTTSSATPSYLIPYKPYTIRINTNTNTVNIYTYDADGDYTVPVKVMVCSDGYDTETLLGDTYSIAYTGRWRWLKMHEVYGQYVTQITGNYLFHSVPYTEQEHDAIEYWAFDYLGSTASAGCIRLQVKDARWIYNHKGDINSVTFYSSSDPGPLGKPIAPKISGNTACRGWDPSDPASGNPWRDAKITVDNYVGMKEADAVRAACEDGFQVGEIAYKHSPLAKGTVIAQSRKSGGTAAMFAGITLTVSAGE